MECSKYLSTLKARRVTASPGERILGSLFPNRGSGWPGGWSQDRLEQTLHLRDEVYICIDAIWSVAAGMMPNIAYAVDAPIPGRTTRACERGLMNLMGRGFDGSPAVGGSIDKRSSFDDPKSTGFSDRGWALPGSDFSTGPSGYSWLTVGEYQSKALSVVKPHEELEPLELNHALRRLIECPNPVDTACDFYYELGMFLELTGVAYEWVLPNRWGMPAERWVIPSHWVWPRTGGRRPPDGGISERHPEYLSGSSGIRRYEPDQDVGDAARYGAAYVAPDNPYADRLIQYYEVRPWGGMGSAGMLRIPPDEIVMHRYKSPINKIDGYSKLAAIAQWIDTEESISRSRWSQMQNIARPEFVVEMGSGYEDGDDDKTARMEAKINAKIQSEYNYGKPLVVPPSTKVTPLSFSPSEMAYFESQKQVRETIRAAWRVPSAWLGQVDNMTFGSILATMAAGCQMAINPKFRQIGQTETKFLASRWDEEAPAWSAGGHGGRASSRRVKLWWDDMVPADPAQVNSDIQVDVQCILPGQELQGRVIGGSKAWYSGKAVHVRTASGVRLSVTENHPVLTVKGFTPAGRLEKGQHLLRHVGKHEPDRVTGSSATLGSARGWFASRFMVRQPFLDQNRIAGSILDEQYAPALVEEVFETLLGLGLPSCRKVPGVGIDFHGDARKFKGQIHVVGSYCELLNRVESEAAERFREGRLVRLRSHESSLAAGRHLDLVGFGERAALHGGAELRSGSGLGLRRHSVPLALPDFAEVGSHFGPVHRESGGFGSASDRDAQLLELPVQPHVPDPEFLSDLLDREPSGIPLDELPPVRDRLAQKPLCFGPASNLDVPGKQVLLGDPRSGAVLASNLVHVHAGEVVLDEIVQIEVVHYDGPVYDFESPLGYIVANSLVVSNCYAITPNEVRALRGRKFYALGGNNPIVNGPGGPMPLPINQEEELGMGDLGKLIGEYSAAANQGAEGVQAAGVRAEGQEEAADIRGEAEEGNLQPGEEGGQEQLASNLPDLGAPKVEEPNGKPSKRFKTKDLDPQGGEEPVIDAEALAAADFVTLPKKVTGTNCSNCEYQKDGICRHEKLNGQAVNERNCCAYWDNPEALREWKKGRRKFWVHGAVMLQIEAAKRLALPMTNGNGKHK